MKLDVGVIKEIDKIGRIVIPKEFRERFGLNEHVEILATEIGVVIRNPEYKLVRVKNAVATKPIKSTKQKDGKLDLMLWEEA